MGTGVHINVGIGYLPPGAWLARPRSLTRSEVIAAASASASAAGS